MVLAAQSRTFRDILISSENIDCIFLPDYSTDLIQILIDLFYDGYTKVNMNQELEVWRLFCHLGLFHIGKVKVIKFFFNFKIFRMQFLKKLGS